MILNKELKKVEKLIENEEKSDSRENLAELYKLQTNIFSLMKQNAFKQIKFKIWFLFSKSIKKFEEEENKRLLEKQLYLKKLPKIKDGTSKQDIAIEETGYFSGVVKWLDERKVDYVLSRTETLTTGSKSIYINMFKKGKKKRNYQIRISNHDKKDPNYFIESTEIRYLDYDEFENENFEKKMIEAIKTLEKKVNKK